MPDQILTHGDCFLFGLKWLNIYVRSLLLIVKYVRNIPDMVPFIVNKGEGFRNHAR